MFQNGLNDARTETIKSYLFFLSLSRFVPPIASGSHKRNENVAPPNENCRRMASIIERMRMLMTLCLGTSLTQTQPLSPLSVYSLVHSFSSLFYDFSLKKKEEKTAVNLDVTND